MDCPLGDLGRMDQGGGINGPFHCESTPKRLNLPRLPAPRWGLTQRKEKGSFDFALNTYE